MLRSIVLAVVRTLRWVWFCNPFTKGNLKGSELPAVVYRRLIIEIQVLSEFKESIDALLLREDTMRLVRYSYLIPPSSFLRSSILEMNVM